MVAVRASGNLATEKHSVLEAVRGARRHRRHSWVRPRQDLTSDVGTYHKGAKTMANDRRVRRRRTRRQFWPTHDQLEKRRLMSLNVTMLSQAPLMDGVGSPTLDLASFSFSTTQSITSYSASISWGDGTTSSGQLYETMIGTAVVVGSHTYGAVGTESISVTVSGDGNTGSGTTNVKVVDTPITAWAVSFSETAGRSYSGNVAEFSDLNTLAPASAFTASITWGNGTTTSGTISSNSGGLFTVSGTNTYSGNGPYDLVVQISDTGGQSAKGGIAIGSGSGHGSGSGSGGGGGGESPLMGTGQLVSPVLGTSFNGSLATFSGGVLPSTSSYTATIYWGDGTSSTGQFASVPHTNAVEVTGIHSYSAAGLFPVSVSVSGTNGDLATAGSSAAVAPPVLTLTGVNVAGTAGQPLQGVVATIADTNLMDQPGDLTASIAWGDGTTTYGLVSWTSSGQMQVTASHAYAEPATYPMTVTVNNQAGNTATVNGTATISAAALTGYANAVQATEGTAFSGVTIATVVSGDPDSKASDLTASITWGDGGSGDRRRQRAWAIHDHRRPHVLDGRDVHLHRPGLVEQRRGLHHHHRYGRRGRGGDHAFGQLILGGRRQHV
jgi:hypothetical protein